MFTRAIRVVSSLFAVGLIASACAEQPAAPIAPSLQAHRDRSDDQPPGLVKCAEIPFRSKTRTIGREGGTITVGPHSLDIPRGALRRSTEITMSVVPDRGVNAVQFEPEGLQFDRPAELTMTYANCDIRGDAKSYRIAYVDDDSLNILYFLRSGDDVHGRRISGLIEHFSTYAVARRDYVIAW